MKRSEDQRDDNPTPGKTLWQRGSVLPCALKTST